MRAELQRRAANILVSIAVGLIVASCATSPAGRAIDASALNDNEGIIFFSVVTRTYASNGDLLTGKATPQISYTLSYSQATSLGAKQVAPIFGMVGKSGGSVGGSTQEPEILIARRLPTGEYSMFKLLMSVGAISATSNTNIRFSVLPNKATYLGTLHIDFYAKKGLFGEERPGQVAAFRIASEAENVAQLFRKQYPGVQSAIATKLMRIED